MLLLLLLLVYSANSYALPPEIETNTRHKRLVGAVDTTIESHPYMVQVEYDGHFICGGTIISKHYVLTAGHCLMLKKRMKIRSGTTFRNRGGVLHDVLSEKIFSYSHKIDLDAADIGLIYVKQPFDCNSRTHQSLDLYKGVLKPDQEVKEKGIIAGWGRTSYGGPSPDKLQTFDVDIYNKTFCNNLLSFGGFYKGQICAGHIGVLHKEVCHGDSGSPLVVNGKVFGIAINVVHKCGQLDYPTVYTEVAYFYDGIKNLIDKDEKC